MHVHTRASDGLLKPEKMVKRAHKAGLAAIAISDHDTVAGVEPAIWEAKKYNIEIIPAIELSCGFNKHEIHMLGYYVDWQSEWFKKKLSVFQEVRRERAKKMIEKLRKLGITTPYNLIIALNGGVIGRPHIARALLERGYIKTFQEAFDRYLRAGKPAYVSKYPLTVIEAIKLIRRAGGLPVLAHPVWAHADKMLPEMVEAGLGGLEVYHTDHDAETSKHYRKLAKKYGLLMTGGSDSHGAEDVPVGYVRVPYSLVEKVKNSLSKSREIKAK
ncbi:MAG: PHP domain-containing protein [Candidatus Hadarchaeota archaeon]|nr:PHP domain-containing protein [Candidatus Hadarchaeota archaeon]